jgi:hypothetical protein
MRWVKVVEVEAGVAVALAVAAGVGQDGWVAPLPPDRVATASAQAVGTASRT